MSAGYNVGCKRDGAEYDLETNVWTMLPNLLPHANGIHRSCSVSNGHKIYITGGHDCVVGAIDTVYVLDTRTKLWTTNLKFVGGGRYDHACSTAYLNDDTHVIIMVGGSGGVNFKVQFLNLDDEAAGWQALPDLPFNWVEFPQVAYLGK